MDDKELVERLKGGANSIAIDGTPSQVGPAAKELHLAASRITVLREALEKIEALKPKPIGDSGFQTGPALLFDHAKAIARKALSGEG